MPESDFFPIPEEIPWKLAATNQILRVGEPEDATISIFYYDPFLESLETNYPDERLVYLKFTLTIIPPLVGEETYGSIATRFLKAVVPVRHLMFDVGIMPEPFRTGAIRPYFHTAAPLRRTMIETGLVGRWVAEDETKSMSMGKSGSQLLETVSSYVSETNLEREDVRSLNESKQVTNRDASQERRELVSHTTHVENVLTLLSAKHIGSPFLGFSLWPRPITSLTNEEDDPERWYQELIRRKSSGIEGIQEFIAIAVVPKGQSFCLQTRMRRIGVVDFPMAEPELGSGLPLFIGASGSLYLRVINYLYRKYPRGTPIDELDVNLWPQIENKYKDDLKYFVRPTVTGWDIDWISFNNRLHADIRCFFRVPYSRSGLNPFRNILYKTGNEVLLEMLRDEYAEALHRSPLERGIVVSFDATLRTCIEMPSTPNDYVLGNSRVKNIDYTKEVPGIVPFKPSGYRVSAEVVESVPESGTSPIHTWDNLDEQLRIYLSSNRNWQSKPINPGSPEIVQLLLNSLESLHWDDSRNLTLAEAIPLFGLDSSRANLLKKIGVCDIRTLAELINATRAYASINEKRCSHEEYAMHLLEQRATSDVPIISFQSDESVSEERTGDFPLSAKDADIICEQIGVALECASCNSH